jgi:chloramphenicol 3-O-phosphotransferase
MAQNVPYRLRLDTGRLSPKECAKEIARVLQRDFGI